MFMGVSALSAPELKNYGFIALDGRVITDLGNEAVIKGYVDVGNPGYVDSNYLGELVVECYVDESLHSTQTVTINVDKNTAVKRMVTDNINVPFDLGEIVFRAYIMSGTEKIRPDVEISSATSELPYASEDGFQYADEISLVKSLGIMQEYENGGFRASESLTRAEFAEILIKIIRKEALAPNFQGSSGYSDVGDLYWALGYINMVSALGFMTGYNDGTFAPESKVSYQQAVTSLVTALGYADSVGPLGFIDKANEIGVSNEVHLIYNQLVSRGALAKLIVNSLEIPIMKNGVVQDGLNNSAYLQSILSNDHKIYKLKVRVQNSFDLASSTLEHLVRVMIMRSYRSYYGQGGEIFEEGIDINLNIGNTDIKELIGYPVIAYVKYDGGEPEVIWVKKDMTDIDEITVDFEQIYRATSRSGYVEVDYFEEKTDINYNKITIDTYGSLYINGHRSNQSLTSALNNLYGTVTFALINSISSYDYDTVFISHYENGIVDSVNMETGRVNMKTGRSIIFSESNKDFSSTLFDEDGNKLDWSVLKENDVLSTKTATGIRVVNASTLVRNTVTGIVSEMCNDEFRIGDSYYKVDYNTMEPTEIGLNDEGIFHLDILGRIVYFQSQFSVTRNYGYIIASDRASGSFEPKLEIQMFTSNNEIVIFKTASIVAFSQGNTRINFGTASFPIHNSGGYDFNSLELKISDYHNQVMAYTVDSQGDIDKISFPENTTSSENYFTKYGYSQYATYRENSKTLRINGLSSVILSDETIIMLAPPAQFPIVESMYEIITLSMLGDGDLMNVSVYDVDRNHTARFVLIEATASAYISPTTGMALVEKVTYDENLGEILTVLQKGERKTIGVENLIEGCIEPFSIITSRVNLKGKITVFSEIAKINSNGELVAGGNFYNNNIINYSLGQVIAKDRNLLKNDKDEVYIIPSSAYIYFYDGRTSEFRNGSIDDFDVSLNGNGEITYSTFNDGDIESVSVLIRSFDGIVDEVIFCLSGEPEELSQTEINLSATKDFASANSFYYNNSDKEINPVFVVARYKDNRLVGMSSSNTPIPSHSYGSLKAIISGGFENGETAKAMLIDNWSRAKPLLNVVSTTISGVPNKNDVNKLIVNNIKSVNIQNNKISSVDYYDSSLNLKTVNLVSNPDTYINGVLADNMTSSMFDNFCGDMEFYDLVSENTYRSVYINKYINTVVDSVNMVTGRVIPKQGENIWFSEKNNNHFALLYDMQGNRLSWSELEENDVLSTKIVKRNNTTTYISTLSRNIVTGTVRASTNENDDEISIDGVNYKIDKNSLSNIDIDIDIYIDIDQDGTIYLDAFGRVVRFEHVFPVDSNYAYIIEALATNGFNPYFEIRAFTSEGEIKILDTAPIVHVFQGKTRTIYGEGYYPIVGYGNTLEGLIQNSINEVIEFSLNSEGKINRISLPENTTSYENYFTKYAGPGNADYRGNSNMLRVGGSSAVVISDRTIIMLAPPHQFPVDESRYEILTVSMLGHDDDDWSRVSVYNVDRNQEARLVVIGDPDSISVSAQTGIALVSRVSTVLDMYGNICDRITVLQNGESKQIDVSPMLEGAISPFMAITPRLNTKNIVTSYSEIAKVSGNSLVKGFGFISTNNVEYVIGTVTAKRDNRISIGDDVYIIPSSANVYLYNHYLNTIAQRATHAHSINVFDIYNSGYNIEYYDEYGYTLNKPVRALIRFHEGVIKDVIVYFGLDYQ